MDNTSVAFEIRPLATFHVASQTVTLPAVHNGVDVETGKRTSGVSVFTRERMLKTYVTDRKEDRDAYIKADPYDITISPRFPHFRVMRDEWSEKEMKAFKVFYQTHPDVCDFNNPLEYDKVAGTPIGKKANAKFLFEEKSSTVKSRIEELEETNLITTLLMSNKLNLEVLRAYLYFLGETPSEKSDAQELYVMLMDMCQPVGSKHRDTFLKSYVRGGVSKEDIERTIVANRAVIDGKIIFSNGIYTYGTEKIGTSLDSVTLWLKGNKAALDAIKREIGMDDNDEARKEAARQREIAEGVEEEIRKREAVAKSKLLKEDPYTAEQFAALKPLFTACGVKNPHLIGNSPGSSENECTLTILLNALNEKLSKQHGFTLTSTGVDSLVELMSSITINVDVARGVANNA